MNEIQIRIPYADTDQMGMVYYANYLIYFERGRTEWLREKGLQYKDLETKGIFLPVSESNCEYVSPARYDDIINVKTKVKKLGFASIEFDYEIVSQDRIIVKGYTKHPFVDKNFKPIRMPGEIKHILEKNNG
ncbi:MAG: acyl-CoA thioesterase [Endomicrobiales bacterium]|nr:acyl-CoA thioesterase [Endomicrobiales bacterium]